MRAMILPTFLTAVAFGLAAVTGVQAQAPTPAVSLSPPGPPLPSAPGVAVMIVLDGSGSMWARLEGERQAKFVTVREALKPLLARIDPAVPVGLTAFGSRRRADCGDVLVAAPVAPGSVRVVAALDRFNPQGKSPLTAALREAAKAFPKSAGPKSLILIHDDLDNCAANPCTALADMQDAAPGIVIHTVGIGLRPEDAQELQCLTGPTQGRSIDGQTATSIATGLDEVVRAALAGGTSVPARPASAAPAAGLTAATIAPSGPALAGARAPLRTDGPPGVRLATVLTAGAGPRTTSAIWVVRRTDAAPDDPPIFAGRGQDIQLPAAPGTYRVDVRDGLVRVAATTVVVPERGQVALDVPLGAGVIRVPVAPAQSEAVFSVFRASANATLGEPLGMVALADAEAGLAIPEGSWIMRIADGRARVDRPIFVRAGEIVDLGPTWPFGRLQLTLTGAVDMARQPPTVVVFEDDPDAPQGRREVARSAASAPEFILPTGTYTVVAQHGFVDVRERITVSGGATVRSTLALGGARLTLTSRLPGDRWPAEAATEPVAYRIERLDAAPAPVYTAHRATADVTIPAGRYRIDARHGLANARVTWDVTLAVGDAVALTLDQTAGFVTFAPPARGTVVAWEVIGADGTALWTSAQPQPRAVLLAGRYTVRLETRDKRVERPIEVRAGDVLAVDMRE